MGGRQPFWVSLHDGGDGFDFGFLGVGAMLLLILGFGFYLLGVAIGGSSLIGW